MPRPEIVLGPMAIRACRDGILVQGDGWRERHPDARDVHLTLLCQGTRVSHVTIEPSDPEADAVRDDLAEEWFAPPRLVELLAQIQRLLVHQWLRHLVPVDLDELTARGFLAMPITEAAGARHFSRFSHPKHPRLVIRNLQRLAEAAAEFAADCVMPPAELPYLAAPLDEPVFVFHPDNDGLDQLWLTFQRRRPDEEPRWHAVTAAAFAGPALCELFQAHLPPGFIAELRRVARHFGSE